MDYKRSFGTRVYIIADKFGIEQTAVNRIINSYISECRQDLLNGIMVRIPFLVDLIPSELSTPYVSTLAMYAKRISCILPYSYHTVLGTIKEYLVTSTEDLMAGQTIDIRTIVSLHPRYENGVVTKIHASISTSVKPDLLNNESVFSVRAHTCKLLKYNVARQVSIMKEEDN